MNTCGRPTPESANFEVSNDPKFFGQIGLVILTLYV